MYKLSNLPSKLSTSQGVYLKYLLHVIHDAFAFCSKALIGISCRLSSYTDTTLETEKFTTFSS